MKLNLLYENGVSTGCIAAGSGMSGGWAAPGFTNANHKYLKKRKKRKQPKRQ